MFGGDFDDPPTFFHPVQAAVGTFPDGAKPVQREMHLPGRLQGDILAFFKAKFADLRLPPFACSFKTRVRLLSQPCKYKKVLCKNHLQAICFGGVIKCDHGKNGAHGRLSLDSVTFARTFFPLLFPQCGTIPKHRDSDNHAYNIPLHTAEVNQPFGAHHTRQMGNKDNLVRSPGHITVNDRVFLRMEAAAIARCIPITPIGQTGGIAVVAQTDHFSKSSVVMTVPTCNR